MDPVAVAPKSDMATATVSTSSRRRRSTRGMLPQVFEQHGKVLRIPGWAGTFDQLRHHNGLRTNSSRVKLVDDRVRVDKESVTVASFSTASTVIGSGIAFVVLLLFAWMVFLRFDDAEPFLSEVSIESQGVSLELPDIAITVSLPSVPEGRVLDYVWPEFAWVEIENGFTNRSDTVELMEELKFGSNCPLKAGYNKNLEGSDCGPAIWPVFCVLNSNRMLRGRFGDPKWSFLSVSLNRCGCSNSINCTKGNSNDTLPVWTEYGNSSNCGCSPKCSGLTADLKKAWAKDGKGTCAPVSELGNAIGMNVWFRFKTEDWKKSEDLQSPVGMIQGGWTWWIYEVLSASASNMMTIELRHNTAALSSKWTFWETESGQQILRWFDWSGYISSPSGTSSGDFLNMPLFVASLRVAWLRREVSVKYFSIQEAISEISGSWALSLTLGALFVITTECLSHLKKKLRNARALAKAVSEKDVLPQEGVMDVLRQEVWLQNGSPPAKCRQRPQTSGAEYATFGSLGSNDGNGNAKIGSLGSNGGKGNANNVPVKSNDGDDIDKNVVVGSNDGDANAENAVAGSDEGGSNAKNAVSVGKNDNGNGKTVMVGSNDGDDNAKNVNVGREQ
eukprot:GEMP01006520.1.p1 GENE.GEMP01006520.1~~GEMP01006520.1.p1  ORF type:complete len:616 (+),score=116.11 GEMP01006520.1:159-2006(+)